VNRYSFLAAILCLCWLVTFEMMKSAVLGQVQTAIFPTPNGTITVNSTLDIVANDGLCTLREAINAANHNSPGGSAWGECVAGIGADVVVLPAGHYTLTIAGANEDFNYSGDLDIREELVLRGAGANATILDANHLDRVIQAFNSPLTLEGFSVVNGSTGEGGGIWYSGRQMAEAGSLTMRAIAVRDNRATNFGGGIFFEHGTFLLEYSEVSNNQSGTGKKNEPGLGAGIYADTIYTSTIRMTTISGNKTAQGIPGHRQGAGVYVGNGDLKFTQATVVNNVVGDGTSGSGGGVTGWSSKFFLTGSLFADNLAGTGPNCYGITRTTGGNVIDDTTDCDFVPHPSDQVNVEPLILPLQHNGGTTRTHALNDTSPAIDSGLCDDSTTDQRGYPRPVDIPSIPGGSSPCDSGAYEVTTLGGTPTVTLTPTSTPSATPTASATPDSTPTPTHTATPFPPTDIIINSTADTIANDGVCTLREAITAANADQPSGTMSGECRAGDGADTIVIPAGVYSLEITGSTENENETGDLDLHSDITLVGVGKEYTVITANGIDRVFHQQSGAVTLRRLAFMHGYAPGGTVGVVAENGGGLLLENGTLTLESVAVLGNRAGFGNAGLHGGHGGGIAVLGGQLSVHDSEIRYNTAGHGGAWNSNDGDGGHGGGIYAQAPATLFVRHSVIDNNKAGNGGSSEIKWKGGRGGNGGGIAADTLIVGGSTISNNEGGLSGGLYSEGIGGDGGGIHARRATLLNSTISDNRANLRIQDATSGDGYDSAWTSGNGGGIFSTDVITLTGVTLAFNDANEFGGGMLGTFVMANSIAFGNDAGYAGEDCYGNLTSLGYNLFGDFSDYYCPITGDITGNQLNVEAHLAPLANNGGGTHTHALLPDSPARDAGNCFGMLSDQRGYTRPFDLGEVPNPSDGCDIGAYEEGTLPPATPTPTITRTPTATRTPTSSPSEGYYLNLPIIQR
jgi:CSLREA domain-containing protein